MKGFFRPCDPFFCQSVWGNICFGVSLPVTVGEGILHSAVLLFVVVIVAFIFLTLSSGSLLAKDLEHKHLDSISQKKKWFTKGNDKEW